MHVISPDTKTYPLSTTSQYTPTPHTISDMSALYTTLGIKNMVFVQPSPYGTDNSLHLDSLSSIGKSHSRAIVVIDPRAPPPASTLQAWHEAGVRGARLNLVSVGRELSDAELRSELTAYAAVLKPMGWALQLYIPLASISRLEPLVEELGLPKVIIDHMGSPSLPFGVANAAEEAPDANQKQQQEGSAALLRMMEKGRTWVKVTGWYRLANSKDAKVRERQDAEVDEMAVRLMRARGGTRVVWASDWPHTRFEGVDVGPWIDRCWKLGERAGGEEVASRMFVDNARELWGFE
jgi:predicted TIM-barrel fold metal-dependent hydrolase